MQLFCLGSSSSGNGYILKGESSALVIEAGVPLNRVKKAMDFQMDAIEGVIISHSHNDHCGRANEYAKAGLQIFSNEDTINTLDKRFSHNYSVVKPQVKIKLQEFTILAFNVVHDVTCYAYLIHHEECGLTCFITDSMYSPARLPGLNNILVEANYMEDVLFDNVMAGSVAPSLADRIRQSHMSFETCIEFLDANDLLKVNNIVLLHLSNQNSNARHMQAKIQYTYGKMCHIADTGTVIELNVTPF